MPEVKVPPIQPRQKYTPIMGVEEWPDIPGHAGSTKIWSGKRKAISEDGRHWLVKKDGWFKKWEWRPVNGMFVHLKEAHLEFDRGNK